MAGFLAVANNNVYHSFINGEDAGVPNGVFVTPDYETGTVKLAADAADVYFVSAENTDIFEDFRDTIDFVTDAGRPLRAHKPSVGEVIVTTKFESGLEAGADATVGANGEVVAGAGLFKVKEVTTAYGEDAVSLLVVANKA